MSYLPRNMRAVVLIGVSIVTLSGFVYAVGETKVEDAEAAADIQQTEQSGSVGTLATPKGITLQPLGTAQGYSTSKEAAAHLEREQIAYATAEGMTLYTHELDPPGRSTCTAECAESWLPAVAPSDAQELGDWSVITRVDGTRQWTYKQKPLYTFVKDVDPGSVHGNSPARFGGERRNGAGELVGGGVRGSGALNAAEAVPLPNEWSVALAYPVSDITTPPGIAIKEVPDAFAIVLVDHRGRTLYTFGGGSDRNAPASAYDERTDSPWVPLAAPQLADATGDFSAIVRSDGIKQWTYKGRPLFTYAKDIAPGYADGIGVDAQYDVAAIHRYFTPRNVTVQTTLSQGKVLASAEGMTLYRRTGYIFQSGGGHSLRRGQPMRPAVGRDIGIDIKCDAECRKVWHPYPAPADAPPAQGLWTVVTHPDGFRQLAYQDYPLWLYDGDEKPGDMTGNDSFDFMFADTAEMKGVANDSRRQAIVDVGTPMDGASGLYWTTAVP